MRKQPDNSGIWVVLPRQFDWYFILRSGEDTSKSEEVPADSTSKQT